MVTVFILESKEEINFKNNSGWLAWITGRVMIQLAFLWMQKYVLYFPLYSNPVLRFDESTMLLG